MGESLIQLFRVTEEGDIVVKVFVYAEDCDILFIKSPGKFRASSRGNTGGASVVRFDWA